MMRKKAGYGKTMKKAKSGSKVKKAGYGKTMKAKAGKKVKKMGYGGKAASMVPPKSKMKKAKAGTKVKKAKAGKTLKEPTNAGMRALPKAVRNKIGFKKNGGKVAKKAKRGAKMTKCKYGCK